MKQCNDVITVYNKALDSDGYDIYMPTVISGVHWFCEVASTVTNDGGLKAANKYTIRVPIDAEFGGKSYTDPLSYSELDNPDAAFTLAQGDLIVHGTGGPIEKPKDLQDLFPEVVTILGVTDNTKAPRGKHWKVVGS